MGVNVGLQGPLTQRAYRLVKDLQQFYPLLFCGETTGCL